MAITLIESWGGDGSNTYVSLTDAVSFFTTHLKESTWTAASTANQQKALMQATRDIDAFLWVGNKYFYNQVLQWPRSIRGGTVSDVQNLLSSQEQVEMKQAVQIAACEQALDAIERNTDDNDEHGELQSLGVVSWSDNLPNISRSFTYDGKGGTRLCVGSKKLLSRYRASAKVLRGDYISGGDYTR